MSLAKWDPFREFEDISTRLNRLFGQGLMSRASERGHDPMTAIDWAPSVDISETPEEFVVKAELPDVKKDDVKVTVERGVLRIEGERRQEKEEKTTKIHRVERSYGGFMRSFVLPDNIDESKLRAEFKDGILDVRLPKSATAKSTSIDVKVT